MIGALTLDQLRVFVAVSETGGFSAASRRLGRVQSAISQSIRTLETIQGVRLFDRTTRTPTLTPAGEVLLAQARQTLREADRFENLAAGLIAGLEPELTLVFDALIPTGPLIDSLRALNQAFPDLAVTFYTEALGGAERRLRNGSAMLAVCVLFPTVPADLEAYALMPLRLVPVAASGHPLACLGRPIRRDELISHVQLILTDPVDAGGPSYGIVSTRIWRFVDQARRLEFLLAGFGWGNMPAHMVEQHLQDGRLVQLDVQDPGDSAASAVVYATHERSRPLRRAGSWLLNDFRSRFVEETRSTPDEYLGDYPNVSC